MICYNKDTEKEKKMILAIILLGIAVAMTIALGIGLILFWFFGWQYKKGNTPKVRWADELSAGRISETEDSLYETKVQNIERKKKNEKHS